MSLPTEYFLLFPWHLRPRHALVTIGQPGDDFLWYKNTSPHCVVQRSIAPLVMGINIRMVLKRNPNDVDVPTICCPIQRSIVVTIP